MSETFRHTTLLTAIRRAGFYCDDVVKSFETAKGVWVASCRDLRGYKVNVQGGDRIHVEPIPYNVDMMVQPRGQ